MVLWERRTSKGGKGSAKWRWREQDAGFCLRGQNKRGRRRWKNCLRARSIRLKGLGVSIYIYIYRNKEK